MQRLPPGVIEEAARSGQIGVWHWHIVTGLITWSEIIYEICGFAAEDFDGTFEAFLKCIHPDDRERVQAAVADAVAAQSQGYMIEHRVLKPSGALVWVESRGRVVVENGAPIAMIGTALDITDRKIAEAQLRSADERLRLFSTHASDYVYDATIDGSVAVPQIVAGSFERTTGLTPAQVAERGGWAEVVHPDDRARTLAMLGELAQGRSVLNEYRIVDGDAHVRWLRDRCVPILDADGKLTRLVGGVTDITQERSLAEQLASAQRHEALARLAGSVAHDFNNLLTVLMAEASFLRDEKLSPDERKQSWLDVDDILDRAAQLTSSLLAFGRGQVGLVEVIDLASVARNSLGILQKAAGETVQVRLAYPDEVLPCVASASDLHLCLLNLTLNARDATPKGGVVTIAVKRVEISGHESLGSGVSPGPYFAVTVSDQGKGIAPEHASKVFDLYFTTKGNAGTGLGLPTCRSIAQRYGGSLELLSTSAKGTTFRMLLPVSEGPVSTPSSVPFRALVGGTEHILLVEDEASLRRATMRALRERGYKVTACASAEEVHGLDFVASHIDGLLTDIRLPGDSGLDLVVALRERFPGLPILLMSGHVDDPRHVELLSQGRYPMIAKPFHVEVLLRRIRQVLDARKAA